VFIHTQGGVIVKAIALMLSMLLLVMLLFARPAYTAPAGAAPIFSIWVTHSLDTVFRDTPVPAHPVKEISLIAAGGEYESGQIVIVPSQPITNITATTGNLVGANGRISRAHVQCRFVDYINIPRNSNAPSEILRPAPVQYPDPLMEAKSVAGKVGENRPLLVTVEVPRGTKAGDYQGRVSIKADTTKIEVPLTVEVLPFNLPKQSSLWVTNWFGPNVLAAVYKTPQYSERFWQMLEAYARELAAHGQNVIEVPRDTVQLYVEPNGALTFDFTNLDRWITICERAGAAGRLELMHMGGRSSGAWDAPMVYAPQIAIVRNTKETKAIELEQYFPPIVKHLKQKGWLKKCILHIADEPIPQNEASYRALSQRVHAVAPEIPQLDAIQIPDGVPGDLQIWVPLIDYFDRNYAAMHKAQQEGKCELWFYTCCAPLGKYPNRFTDYPLTKTRIIHWANYLYDATGFLHWGLNWWNEGIDLSRPDLPVGDAWDEALDLSRSGLPPGDQFIVYPGTNGLRSSLRFEAMRDGLEDYEYFKLLAAKRGTEHAKDLGRQMMRAMTDYDTNPEKMLRIRRQMAREIAMP
jgi:hypothetical protein